MAYVNMMCKFLCNYWQQLLPPAVQLLGIACSAIVIVWQLRRQHKDQADRQSAQARDEIFIRIYESFSQDIQACQDKITDLSITILTCPGRIDSYWLHKTELGLQNPATVSDRSESLSRMSFDLDISVCRLKSTMERYEIVFANQRLFQAFQSVLTMQLRARAEAFQCFLTGILAFLPTDVPQSQQAGLGCTVVEGQRLDKQHYDKVHKLAEIHLHECTQLEFCLIDLLHETQNNLLGHLFQREIPPRIPRNDDCLSVRNDDAVLTRIEERARIWEEQLNPERQKQEPDVER